MKIILDTKELEALAKKLGSSHPIFLKHFNRILHEIVIRLEGLVQDKTSVGATNILRNSIFGEVRGAAGSLHGVVATSQLYGEPVEVGTRPHFPPLEPIRQWALRVLGDESLAFVVARSISKKGTKGKYMFRDALEEAKPEIATKPRQMAERITRELGFK